MPRRRIPLVHELPGQVPKYLSYQEVATAALRNSLPASRLQAAGTQTRQCRDTRLLHRQQHHTPGPLGKYTNIQHRLITDDLIYEILKVYLRYTPT